MLQKSVTELKEEIDRLEKHYVFSTNEMKRLTGVLFEKTSDYETLSKKLNSFQKEFAVTDRKYHAAKNRIAFLQKVTPPMEDDLKDVNIELHEYEQEINLLNSQKKVFEDKLSNIQKIRDNLLKELSEKESENKQILSDIKATETEKQIALYSISDLLSKSSMEHLRSEQELDEFSTDFIRAASERGIIKTEFNEKRQQVDHLTEKVTKLESIHAELTETVVLEKSLKILETSVQTLEADAKTEENELLLLEKELYESKRTLEALSTNNIVKRDSLSSLANEVKSYNELALTVQASESRLRESEKSIKKAILDLETNFRNHVQLKKKFYLQPDSHVQLSVSNNRK